MRAFDGVDYSKLIGRPYDRVNCFDFIREFYLLVFGIEVKAYYSGGIHPKVTDTENLIRTSVGEFEMVDGEPEFGDIMLMRVKGFETHVGVYLNRGTFAHSIKPVGSCVDRVDRWKNSIAGYYRHKRISK